MNRGREVAVGIVIILAVVVGATGTLFLKGARFGEELTPVDVLTRDVGQLMVGNAVKFRGVPIGTIDLIEVVRGGEAVRVRLELEGEPILSDDAVVIIAPESLFGDWEAEIVSRSRFPRYDYYEVPEGSSEGGVPVIGGYAIPDISRLTATAEAVAENVGALTERFDRAFNEETADALAQAIRDIQSISTEVRRLVEAQSEAFENISNDVETAVADISTAAATGRTTLERVDSLIARGDVNTILERLSSASVSLERMSANMSASTEDFGGTVARLDSALVDIEVITSAIREGEGSLGMLLTDTALYVRAERTLTRLDSLLADVKRNPGRYINLSIF